MPTLIIRDVPEKTYKALKNSADLHRRSMSKEALVLLEEELHVYDVPPVSLDHAPQFKLKNPPKNLGAWVVNAVREGRA